MQKAWESPLHVEIRTRTRTERRQKSLRRGISRWHLDTLQTVKVNRVHLIALTFVEADPMAARGAIREFWDHYRHISAEPYFSWVELQQRGAVHYHAIIVNPPWRREGQARRWLTDHWSHSEIQPHVQVRSGSWFLRAAGRYVKAYAKKEGLSKHQQDYEELPREIRTFQCSRTTWPAVELDAHLERPAVVNLADPHEPWEVRKEHFWITGVLEHVPGPGGCILRSQRRVRHQSKSRTHQKGTRSVPATRSL